MQKISKLALVALIGTIILAGCSATTGGAGYGNSGYGSSNHGYSGYGNSYGNRSYGSNY